MNMEDKQVVRDLINPIVKAIQGNTDALLNIHRALEGIYCILETIPKSIDDIGYSLKEEDDEE